MTTTKNRNTNATQMFTTYVGGKNFLVKLPALLVLFAGLMFCKTSTAQTVSNFTTTGTWTCPEGVTSVTVECWGGGGAGAAVGGNPAAGGGGAGGAYVRKVVSVVPGAVYTVTVGGIKASGTKTATTLSNTGNPSWFSSTTLVYAAGGPGAAGGSDFNSHTGAGASGTTANSIGDVIYAGGSGTTGLWPSGVPGGAGGGAAGTSGNGGNASGGTGGTGGAGNPNTGNGGNGPADNAGGVTGSTYGGGGSGGKANTSTDRAGGTGAAGYVRIQVPAQIPNTPGPLLSLANSSTSITLYWNDLSSVETGYEIERSTSGSDFTLIHTTPANYISYTDDNLTQSTPYQYRVRAITATEHSIYASTSSTTFGPSSIVPFTTSGTWICPSNVTSITVECWGGGGAGGTVGGNPAASGGGAGGAYTKKLVTVVPGTWYTVTVAGVKNTGTKAATAAANNGNPSWFGSTSLIYAEGGAGAAGGGDVASFNGAAGIGSSINSIGDIVYAGGSGAAGNSVLGGAGGAGGGAGGPLGIGANGNGIGGGRAGFGNPNGTSGGSGGSRVLNNAVGMPGNPYGGGGAGGKANATTDRVGGNGAAGYVRIIIPLPNAPTNLTAIANNALSVALSWTDNSTNESGFEIERSIIAGGGFTLIQTTSSNATSFNDLNVAHGQIYYYRVRAVNGAGPSSYTTAASAEGVDVKQQAIDELSFQYRYDDRKRMIRKRVPGSDWVYMVYDDRDRLVMTQDGNQRAQNKWLCTKYDQLNRPIITGTYSHHETIDQEAMSALISTTIFYETRENLQPNGYTNSVFPTTNFEALIVTYYDDYSFISLIGNAQYNYNVNQLPGQYNFNASGTSFPVVKGLITATKINVLGEATHLWSINYFDDKYRVVQVVATNAKNGIDRTTNIYDFVGKVLDSKIVHNETLSAEKIVSRTFNYDHAGRLKKTWHKIGTGNLILLSANVYNEMGQLLVKRLYNTDPPATSDASRVFMQNIDFRYNIRGWLNSMNDLATMESNDLFGMNLHYNNPTANGGTAQFNGNISEMRWQNPDSESQSYGYYYDPMSRLLEAKYYNITDPLLHTRYDEVIKNSQGGAGYDLNGNILFLQRRGKTGVDPLGVTTYGDMDDLTYTYRSNQLLNVSDSDAATEGFKDGTNPDNDYQYDINGNLQLDKNKSINGDNTANGNSLISYNHLNLPNNVVTANGEYLKYSYDASGRKLKQQLFDASNVPVKTSIYAGEFFYENDVLIFINHEEGRVIVKPGSMEYQYYLKDHLGNVRVTFSTTCETEEKTATLEPENTADEYANFLRYENARKVHSSLFDHTNGAATGYAQRLSGRENEKFGLAKSLSVMPGDVISMEVFAKYVDASGTNTQALTDFIAAIVNGTSPAGTVVDGGGYGTSTSSFSHAGVLSHPGSGDQAPMAYLNYIMFDRDFNPIITDISQTNFVKVSLAAKENGSDVAHERLFAQVTVKQAGYMYIYLSNDNPTPVEVYYDDLKVEHLKCPVVQMDDYYPFGLTFNSYQREDGVDQKYLYNGKELQDQLDLNWLDFGFRYYDPAIGRFTGIDPLADKFRSVTPYNYAENSPVANIDLWGLQKYYAGDGSVLGQVGDNTDVRVVNSAMTNAQAIANIQSGSAESTQALTANSVAFADYFQTVADVTNDAPLETYSNNGNDCKDAADAQLINEGLPATVPADAIHTMVDNTAAVNTKDANNPNLVADPYAGAIRIQTELNGGNPVQVGVKEPKTNGTVPNPGNVNALTGHFVVIRSVTVTNGVVTFNYLDNAKAATGKSPANNNFTMDTTTGTISDNTITQRSGYTRYDITEVRRNN